MLSAAGAAPMSHEDDCIDPRCTLCEGGKIIDDEADQEDTVTDSTTQARALAEQIFSKINDSYMVFNKGAKYGINHNTELLIKELVTTAIQQAATEARQAEAEAISLSKPSWLPGPHGRRWMWG